MSAPVLDEREHLSAVKALLDTALGSWTAYGIDEVPTDLPDIFAAVSLERRFVEPMHAARSPRSGWRVAVHYVGRVAAEARWAAFQGSAALDGVRLTVDDRVSTPVAHESSQAIVRDDEGRYSALVVYTYAL